MGWKLNGLAFLFALWALNTGALVIGIPILLYLFYGLWSNRQARPAGTGSSRWMTYLGVFLLVLSLVAVMEQGTYSPVVFGGAGIVLLALAVFPQAVHNLADDVAGPASELFGKMSGREERKDSPCIELTQIPLDHADGKKADPREKLLRFQRLALVLAESGEKVQLRIDFSAGRGRVLFRLVSRSQDERTTALLQAVKSQLPEFRPELSVYREEDAYTVPVEGVPEPSVDPLGPLAKYFLENKLEGSYAVTISPAWVNPLSRWSAGWSQRRLAESSGFQHYDHDRATTSVDHGKQVELQDAVKGMDRLLARRPVRVAVQVSAKEEAVAVQAAGILAGTLSSHDRFGGLKVRRAQAPGKFAWQRSVLTTPPEAAPYLWLPQSSLGMKVAPSAEFQAPEAAEGEVSLGEVVSLSGRTGRQARIGLDQLAKHVFVTGTTGSGKSTSCFGLLVQLDGLGVPFLVVEPVKADYRRLLRHIPGLQVFTVGDEGTAPFRLNIFEPPAGVKVQAHLENLVAVWNASFVTYSPVQYVVPRVFAETYRARGWDLATDRRGQPITIDDVREQVRKVVRVLGYEPKVTMDIEAAINVRLDGLSTGSKGRLFGAPASTSLQEIMTKPTVVELKEIRNDEEKAFVASLLLMNLAGFVQARGASRSLRHFTLVEEAHRLLPNVSTQKGDPEATDPRRMVVEQFGNMLAELRAYGEGLAVVEQIPTKILPDAIKNTATKVVHRVATLDDRRVMAGAMNATKEQATVLTALKPGEAVVSVEGHPVPFRVDVEDVAVKIGLPEETTDEEVRERMAEHFLSYTVPRDGPKPAEERMRDMVDSESLRDGFLRAYRVWYRQGRVEPLASFLLLAARSFAPDRAGTVEAAVKILSMATSYYLPFDAEQRAKFPMLFRRELEKGMAVG